MAKTTVECTMPLAGQYHYIFIDLFIVTAESSEYSPIYEKMLLSCHLAKMVGWSEVVGGTSIYPYIHIWIYVGGTMDSVWEVVGVQIGKLSARRCKAMPKNITAQCSRCQLKFA